MKLSTSIGGSLGGGAIVAAAAWNYVSARGTGPGSWQQDVIAGAWTMFGGAGGIGIAVYGVLSFAFLTVGAIYTLHHARTRLDQEAADPSLLPEAWRSALAGTDFETLATHLPGDELTIAPLALLRVLRHEIWRLYGARLIGTQLVTIVLACIAVLVASYWAPVAPALAGAARLEEILATLTLTIALGAWLLIDNAIRDLAVTASGIAAAWEARLRDQPPSPSPRGGPASAALASRSETIVAAIDKLAATIAAPPAEEAAAATPALSAIEAALRESIERQGALIEGLCETLTQQIGQLTRTIEQRDANSVGEIGGTSEALIQLAASVDRLADPLLRRLRLLDTADRRLLTVLRRQEEAVASVGTKWSELVVALQAMSTGLDRFAQASSARYDEVLRLQPGAPVGPSDLTDELQELLDEMSEGSETDLRHPSG